MKKKLIFLFLFAQVAFGDIYESNRQEMVRVIKRHSQGDKSFFEGGKMDPKVTKVMGEIPRHLFVPEDLKRYAY
ncbi:MAG: protein-L-isoaspartate O-methyltransferase, partial [Bdellovibrionota bacterium]|nr:protein-L-isoaspartate O-methyltransferase [Bdellovibrionota bacterium]